MDLFPASDDTLKMEVGKDFKVVSYTQTATYIGISYLRSTYDRYLMYARDVIYVLNSHY